MKNVSREVCCLCPDLTDYCSKTQLYNLKFSDVGETGSCFKEKIFSGFPSAALGLLLPVDR